MNKSKIKTILIALLLASTANSAWALDVVDGVYQIGTADHLIEFAGIVNGGENNANAVLTANIDMSGKSWTPIGDNEHRYIGTFDGQFHMIDNLVYEGGEKVGIFGVVNGGCTIKNLIAGPNNSIKGTSKVGGIIGCSDGSGWVILENVGHEGYVEGTGNNCCCIIGVVMNGGPATRMTNCYNTGNAKAGGESAIITGWFGGHGSVEVKGFWNTGEVLAGVDTNQKLWRNSVGITIEHIYSNYGSTQGEQSIADGTVSSGAFAYLLNGNSDAGLWLQNLEGSSIDSHPTLLAGHGQVYANGYQNCDGTPKDGNLTYSNHSGGVRDSHQYENGFCSVCEEIQTDFLQPEKGYYLIDNAVKLDWFAAYVNSVDNTVNAMLTGNVDFSGYKRMIGDEDSDDKAFKGTFDGQGYRVTIAYETEQKNAALFRYLNGATIKNLITEGTLKNENHSCSGGIFAGSRGSTEISNCVSYVTFNRSNGGDATIGGIGAYMHDTGRIQNCAFYGAINAPNAEGNGGLLGYANGGNGIEIKNCVVNASSFTFSGNSVSVARNTGNVTNTYVVNAGNATQGEQIRATPDQLPSGELAYLLNEKVSGGTEWYQLIGTDAAPLPIAKDDALVYANGSFYCDGTPSAVVYSNTNTGAQTAAHSFTDGICVNEHDGIVCGDADPNYLSPTDGYYELSVANHLKWFAAFVNKGHGDNAKAKLTNDIDMDGVGFPGIGNEGHNFSGEIDGQQHKLSHLVMDFDQQGVGLVSRAGVGVHLKNLTIDNTCSFTGKEGVGAFIGGAYGNGGTITIENCGNEAPITATSKNAGALIGCNYADENNVVWFKNCYNTGSINSTAEGGALSGWVHNSSKVLNCYNTGTLTGCEGFIRGYNQAIDGCYSTSNTNSGTYGRAANEEITTAADGTLFAALFAYNDNNIDGSVWRFVDGDNAHPVLYGNMIAMSENYKPNEGETNGLSQAQAHQYDVTFFRTIKTGGWNTFCVPFAMTAAQITDYFGSGTEVAQLKEETFTDDMLHFELVQAIEAGKAYLVYPAIDADFTKKAIENVTIAATEPITGTTQAGYTFQGVFEPTALTVNTDFIVAGGNSIVKTSGGNLKGFRAYFKGSSNARATTFVIDDTEATGIITAEGEVVVDAPVYNMQGQRVKGTTRGLYITNGKKYVVK